MADKVPISDTGRTAQNPSPKFVLQKRTDFFSLSLLNCDPIGHKTEPRTAAPTTTDYTRVYDMKMKVDVPIQLKATTADGGEKDEENLVPTERTLLVTPSLPMRAPQLPPTKGRFAWRRMFQCVGNSFWLEHAAFFLGTLCATLAASLDLSEAINYNEADDDDSYDGPWENPLLMWDAQKALSVASTLLYLLDSLLETNCRWFPSRRREAEELDKERHHHFNFPALFGIAALFDMLSSLFESDDEPWMSFCFEVTSVHFFLFCAILTVYRHVYRPMMGFGAKKNILIMTGDTLFLVGALIDLAVSYGDHPLVQAEEEKMEWIWNASLGLSSSLTWMLDSILYLLADMIYGDDEDEDSDTDDGTDDFSSDDSGGESSRVEEQGDHWFPGSTISPSVIEAL